MPDDEIARLRVALDAERAEVARLIQENATSANEWNALILGLAQALPLETMPAPLAEGLIEVVRQQVAAREKAESDRAVLLAWLTLPPLKGVGFSIQ